MQCYGAHPLTILQHEGTKGTKAFVLALSHEVIGAAIEVHRFLGPGLRPVNYKGEILECHMKLDLLVERSLIVEVKSLEKVISVHKAQLLTYLKLRNLWLGLPYQF
jgi:PD-(D/E)XK nuclease superfamily